MAQIIDNTDWSAARVAQGSSPVRQQVKSFDRDTNRGGVTKSTATWQEELAEQCKKRNISAPQYEIVSDRRGGRSAWSAKVTIKDTTIAARYWYDQQFLNNAKEDAAEVAAARLGSL